MSKFLTLVLILVIAWYGFRWYARVGQIRRERQREATVQGAAPRSRLAAEDMEKCPRCGTYVSVAAASSCGRTDCPYGR